MLQGASRLVVLAVVTVLTCACSGSEQQGDEADLKQSASFSFGTYVAKSGTSPRLTLLTLMSDQTSYREDKDTGECTGPDCGATGLFAPYSWGRQKGFDYLRFYDDIGSFEESYAYEVHGNTLRLRKSKTKNWFELLRAPEAWC